MADLSLRLTMTAQNRATRPIDAVSRSMRALFKITRQVNAEGAKINAHFLAVARGQARVAREQARAASTATRAKAATSRTTRALTLEEARASEALRASNRAMREQAREVLGVTRAKKQASRATRALTLEEARASERRRADNRAMRAQAKASLGIGTRRGYDPDAPATNLGIAGAGLTRVGDSTLRTLTAATRRTLDYGRAVREVSTLTENISREQLDAMTLASARLSGQAPVDQAAALYQIVSAGYTDAADAQRMLIEASKAGVAGVGTTEEAFEALNAIMRPYGQGADDAARASDLLFSTIRDGKTTLSELGHELGAVASIANEAGISQEGLLGAISALTAGANINTAEATTAMRGVASKIVGPTKQGRKEFERLGVGEEGESMADVLQRLEGEHGPGRGLPMLLRRITESKEYLGPQSMKLLFEDIEALNAVLALTGPAADEFERALKNLDKAAGEGGRAFDKMVEDPALKLERLRSELEAGLIETMRELVPLIADVAAVIGPLVRDVAGFAKAHPDLTKAALVLVAGGGLVASAGGRALTAASIASGLSGGAGFGAFAGGGGAGAVAGGALNKAGAQAGKMMGAVAGAQLLLISGAIGYAIGSALDSHFGLSDKIAALHDTSAIDALNAPGQGAAATPLAAAQRRLAAISAQAESEGVGGIHRGSGTTYGQLLQARTDVAREGVRATIKREGATGRDSADIAVADAVRRLTAALGGKSTVRVEVVPKGGLTAKVTGLDAQGPDLETDTGAGRG